MTLNRRRFIGSLAAGAAVAGLGPRWSHATTTLGDMTVETLSDGTLTLPAGFIFGESPSPELTAIREAFGLTGEMLTPPCNLTLVRHEDRVVLFDAGSGPGFQASAGQLMDALDAIGLAPEDVTHVVFTHGHPDHLWGVLDDFDDPLFYEAEHMMGRVEFDYWMDPATIDTIGAERQSFAAGAKRRLESVADQITLFDDGEEVLPGIAAVATFGHSPGHMAFELRSGGAGLMVVGDAIGNHHAAFARPDLELGSDQDPTAAAATRGRLFDKLVTDDLGLIGFHLPDGGMGRADASGDGFVFVPDPG